MGHKHLRVSIKALAEGGKDAFALSCHEPRLLVHCAIQNIKNSGQKTKGTTMQRKASKALVGGKGTGTWDTEKRLISWWCDKFDDLFFFGSLGERTTMLLEPDPINPRTHGSTIPLKMVRWKSVYAPQGTD
jgi:hypothetical protein